jgi:putative membrane protein
MSKMQSEPRKLHPSSLLFGLGSAAKRLLIPGIIVLAASRGNRAEIWLMLMFVPAAIASIVKYISYRYRFGQDEILIREGIITRNERHIPYARIQNIDLAQNPVHRMLGVAEVRLETASGQKPEAIMRVLSLHAVEAMRARVFEGRQRAEGRETGAENAVEPLVRMPLRELITLGLLSNRALALIAAAFGAIWQFDLFDIESYIDRLVDNELALPESVALHGLWSTTILAVGALLSILLLFKLLSVVWVILKYYGFTLTSRGEGLRAEYGLLTKISATIPRHRIQLLSIKRSPLQRWLGRAAVQVETAGGREEDEGSSVDRLWLAPLIREEQVAGLLAKVQPEIDPDALDWLPLAPRARRRLLRKSLILLFIVTALGCISLKFWGLLLLLPGLPLALLHSALYVKHTAYATGGGAIFYRSGWWVRRLSIVRYDKIQALSLGESPFDRRNGMAGLAVDTAGAGKAGHGVRIRYLLAETAKKLQAGLFRETCRTAFRW